ncbi:MAG: TfoX/Sxy family protein [Candidatus Binatia bacterium]
MVARFEGALPVDPRCQRRQMFGCPAALADGRLFACVHQNTLVLRLDAGDREALRRAGGLPFEPMPGRVMRDYLAVPAELCGDARRLRRWLGKAFTFTCALPPKRAAKRPPKAAAAPRRPRRT